MFPPGEAEALFSSSDPKALSLLSTSLEILFPEEFSDSFSLLLIEVDLLFETTNPSLFISVSEFSPLFEELLPVGLFSPKSTFGPSVSVISLIFFSLAIDVAAFPTLAVSFPFAELLSTSPALEIGILSAFSSSTTNSGSFFWRSLYLSLLTFNLAFCLR